MYSIRNRVSNMTDGGDYFVRYINVKSLYIICLKLTYYMSIVIKNKFLKRINEIIFKKKLNRPIAQCHLHEFKCTHTKQQLISIRIYLNPKVYFSYCLLQILYFVFHLSTQHLSNFYFSYLCHFFSVFLIIKVSSIRDLKLFGSLLFSHFL